MDIPYVSEKRKDPAHKIRRGSVMCSNEKGVSGIPQFTGPPVGVACVISAYYRRMSSAQAVFRAFKLQGLGIRADAAKAIVRVVDR